MIEQIDAKYFKQRRENGDVFVKWATWVDKHEQKVVKEPVPVVGKLFPFIKRKKTIDVVVGQEGPIVMEHDVYTLLKSNNPTHQKLAKEIPYDKILNLDEKIYGKGLFLGRRTDLPTDKVHGYDYDILTEAGVVIGKVMPPHQAYYATGEKTGVLDADFKFDAEVTNYCNKNTEVWKHVPLETQNTFPQLKSKAEEVVAEAKKSKVLSDGGKA